MSRPLLAIVETHPVQYHAPVWRRAAQLGVDLQVIYGADFSVRGYHDREFGASFVWDGDLLAGYRHQFLSTQAEDYTQVDAHGLSQALEALEPTAVLALGHHHRLDVAAQRWARRHQVGLWFRGEVNETSRRLQRRWLPMEWLRALRLRRRYRAVEYCLPIGRRALEHYQRMGVPAHRLIASPYAVDPSAFRCLEEDRSLLRAQARRQAGIDEGALVVAFSGKLSQRKGVHLLPAAMNRLAAVMDRPLALLLIGDGELRETLSGASKVGQTWTCHCTGFVNQGEISRWYHAADVLTLPSLWGETWGLVVNDALHHGLPVVVSDAVGCAPDLVRLGSTGEVCAAGDVDSLWQALREVLRWSGLDAAHKRRECREQVQGCSVEAAALGLLEAWRRHGSGLSQNPSEALTR